MNRLLPAVEAFLTPQRSPRSPREEALLRQGESLSWDCRWAATSWGAGRPVLLAHGWQSRRTHWAAFIPALTEAGFRTIAVDAPGHGESPGDRTHVLEFGRAILDIGDEIGPLAGVVGHSYGSGAVALALQRGLAAEKAVLISGPAALTGVIERFGRSFGLEEDLLADFAAIVMERIGEPVESFDVAAAATAQKCPALIVHDEDDKEIPCTEGKAVARAWPGATLLLTRRHGHRRILLAPEVVRKAVAFLAGTE